MLFVVGCGSTSGTAPSPTRTAAEAGKAFYTDVLSKHDVGAMDSLVSSTVVDHDPVAGQPPGLAGFRQRYAALMAAFPDLAATADDVISDGQKAAVQNTLRGTQSGPFLGAPPTGKALVLSATDVFTVVNGKITEHWGRQDDASIRLQLGLK